MCIDEQVRRWQKVWVEVGRFQIFKWVLTSEDSDKPSINQVRSRIRSPTSFPFHRLHSPHPHCILLSSSQTFVSQTQRTGETEKALRGRSAGTALGLGGGGRLRLRRADELAGVGSRMTRRTATLLGVQPIEGESLPPWRPKEKEPAVSQRSKVGGTDADEDAEYSGSAEQSRAPTPAPLAATTISAASSSSSSSSSSSFTSSLSTTTAAFESAADLMTDAAPSSHSAESSTAAAAASVIRSTGSASGGASVAKRSFSEISPEEGDAGADSADSADADAASEAEADGDEDDEDDDAEEQPLEELPQDEEEEEEDQDDDFAGDAVSSEQQVDETGNGDAIPADAASLIASAAFSLNMSDELE